MGKIFNSFVLRVVHLIKRIKIEAIEKKMHHRMERREIHRGPDAFKSCVILLAALSHLILTSYVCIYELRNKIIFLN